MNTATSRGAWAERWSAWRATAAVRWQALGERERLAVAAAAALVAVALLWWVGLQPALRTLREAPAQLTALESQLQSMRALAAEAVELRGATPVSTGQAVAALEAATRSLGRGARLVVQGDRATLQLDAVDPMALAQWLELARSAARARPIELQMTRGPSGYSGSLVVSLGGGR